MPTLMPTASIPTELENFARLRFVLQQDIRRLELRSDAAAARIREVVAVGDVCEVGGFVVRVVGGRPILEVVDPSLVQREFLTTRPDDAALLRRFLATREVPAGCRVRDRRASVYVLRSIAGPRLEH